MGWLGAIGTGIAFGWRNRKEIIALGQALLSIYKTITQKIEDKALKGKRDANVDKAVETKNPDKLEDSFRTGGGGA